MTELPVCPTAAGAPCGCCPDCLAQQVAALMHESPSDLDVSA